MESLAIMLSVLAAGSVVFITGLNLYFKIRHKFPIRVNCWFCNSYTDVPYGNRNYWDCPNCEQYNGFLSDGSYNKTIPAQHDELLNQPVHAVSPRKKSLLDANGNGLCRKCNINQELKVQQLALFMPVNPARYDEEVDEFRRHLERAYRLCSSCEEVLKMTLHKQKSMLLGFKLTQLRNSSLHKGFVSVLKARCFQFYLSWNRVARYFATVLAACLVLAASVDLNDGQLPLSSLVQNSTLWCAVDVSPHVVNLVPVTLMYEIPLTALGTVTQFVVTVPRKRGNIGIICVCFWIVLHAQSWLKRWEKLEEYISLLDFSIVHVVIAFVTLCVCTLDALVARGRYPAVKCHNIARKGCSRNSSLESSRDLSNISDDGPTPTIRNCQQKHVNSSSSSHEVGVKLPKVCDFYPISGTSAPTSSHIEHSPSTVTSNYEDNNSEDLGRGFGNLNLGSSSYENWMSRKNNGISSFETKVYGQNRCNELFNGSLRNRKRPIIRPSQLSLCKNVTQSSWVAGGYWQSPVHGKALPLTGNESQEMSTATAFAPLSRSSSQSSGFVSQSSQPGVCDGATSLPNSCTGSTCGADFDSFSALSEPVCSYTAAPTYCARSKRGTFVGTPYYGGPPVFTHQTYSMIPQMPTFLPSYGSPLLPQPQPVPCYYAPQSPRPLSPIWNPSAFSIIPLKPPHTPAVDVLSRSSSQNSNDSRSSVDKSSTETAAQRHRTFLSAVRDNLFLAVLFFVSLLFNALILVCVMLWNSSTLFPGILS